MVDCAILYAMEKSFSRTYCSAPTKYSAKCIMPKPSVLAYNKSTLVKDILDQKHKN